MFSSNAPVRSAITSIGRRWLFFNDSSVSSTLWTFLPRCPSIRRKLFGSRSKRSGSVTNGGGAGAYSSAR